MLLNTGWLRIASVLLMVVALSACAKELLVYTPPNQRPRAASDQPWRPDQFLSISYHDVEDDDPDQAFMSVRTDRLAEQFNWLRENGYQAVTVDQILAASQGAVALPERSVLLTFDDGYRSFYTRVLPLLKAYQWPAVLAPIGSWLDTPIDQPVDFGGVWMPRQRFLTWDQVREIAQSGLVEIAAHTDALHYGALANPQGNQQPAAAVRIYDPQRQQYEDDAQYEARLKADVQAISGKIERATGKKPRVWVWPYGAAGGAMLRIAADNGYQMALTLEGTPGQLDQLMSVPRLLLANDPTLGAFGNAVVGVERSSMMRVAHVDLDYVYDPDPEQTNRNLGELVQRILDMRVTTVFLQAYSDPAGDGLVRSVYFPNRWLPVRADLFNRVAWQLLTRAGVNIYAWMPVLAYDLDPSISRVTRWQEHTPDAGTTDPLQYQRLSPFDPVARSRIADLYEDLARHAIFHGILFHDDALLSDFEDASPAALAAYRAAGLPDRIDQLRADGQTLQRWTRFKSRHLIDFTAELAQRVRAVRGPQIKTARNIFAAPVLDPEAETWFAQNLDDFLGAYDWTAPMAMPLMENVPKGQENAWLDRLVERIAQRPGGLDKTVIELQARDWRAGSEQAGGQMVDSAVLAGWMQRLQLHGVRSYGYYPDDFVQDQPRLHVIRPVISTAWYPFQ